MADTNTTCATDKEIFDFLMGARRRFTEPVLLSLAKERGIFYSADETRETLASNVSLLPHGFNELSAILHQREVSARSEKVTHVSLSTPVTMDQLKDIADAYIADTSAEDKVVYRQCGANNFLITVEYTEIDYSKTRLVQRRQREAEIEFIVQDDLTTVRMPANGKAREIARELKERLDQTLHREIPVAVVELTDLHDPALRTEFFNSLISKMPGFRLQTVTNVKVESTINSDEDDAVDFDDDEDVYASEKSEMLAIVRSAALRGESLLLSAEYQELREKGFFIAWIVWRANQTESPYHLFEFEAGFEEPEASRGFKYNVRGMAHLVGDKYTKSLKPVTRDEKLTLFGVVESTARAVLTDLRVRVSPELLDNDIAGVAS